MPEACHRQLAKLTAITHGLCARGFLLFWPRLPLCPWASHPEPDRSILYLEVIILMANTRDKPDNHSLISQRLPEGHTASMTMELGDVFHFQGGIAGHKTAGGVRDPLM